MATPDRRGPSWEPLCATFRLSQGLTDFRPAEPSAEGRGQTRQSVEMSRSGRSLTPVRRGCTSMGFSTGARRSRPRATGVSGKPAVSCRPRSEFQRHDLAILQLPPGQTGRRKCRGPTTAITRSGRCRKPVAEKLHAVGRAPRSGSTTMPRSSGVAVAVPPDLLQMIEGQARETRSRR